MSGIVINLQIFRAFVWCILTFATIVNIAVRGKKWNIVGLFLLQLWVFKLENVHSVKRVSRQSLFQLSSYMKKAEIAESSHFLIFERLHSLSPQFAEWDGECWPFLISWRDHRPCLGKSLIQIHIQNQENVFGGLNYQLYHHILFWIVLANTEQAVKAGNIC